MLLARSSGYSDIEIDRKLDLTSDCFKIGNTKPNQKALVHYVKAKIASIVIEQERLDLLLSLKILDFSECLGESPRVQRACRMILVNDRSYFSILKPFLKLVRISCYDR